MRSGSAGVPGLLSLSDGRESSTADGLGHIARLNGRDSSMAGDAGPRRASKLPLRVPLENLLSLIPDSRVSQERVELVREVDLGGL